jgi:hypothetical protein
MYRILFDHIRIKFSLEIHCAPTRHRSMTFDIGPEPAASAQVGSSHPLTHLRQHNVAAKSMLDVCDRDRADNGKTRCCVHARCIKCARSSTSHSHPRGAVEWLESSLERQTRRTARQFDPRISSPFLLLQTCRHLCFFSLHACTPLSAAECKRHLFGCCARAARFS